ncbi:MAG: aminotransferase class V-fold PLP-dependent enzyme [Nitrospirales bacterium]
MIYLNYAAMCPTHPEIEKEVSATLTELKKFLYSEAGIQWYRAKIQHCRETVAQFLHVSDPFSIAFVPNASTANYLLLSSINWNTGDVIVSTTHENPSIRNELVRLKANGVETEFLSPTSSQQQFLASLESILNKQTIRAIILSHVSHVDGRVFPIDDIAILAKTYDTLCIVDGAQAVGHIPVNLERLGCDAYFFSGYKWCEGPLGTGALAINHRFFEMNPLCIAAGSQQNKHGVHRFEIGTHNIGLTAGLAKACERKEENGLDVSRLSEIREFVKNELVSMGDLSIQEWRDAQAPGILTFQFRNAHSHEHLTQKLQHSSNLAVKIFSDYPMHESPSIRLSWTTAINEQVMNTALETIKLCV